MEMLLKNSTEKEVNEVMKPVLFQRGLFFPC